ncbi:MAG: hypothetical protein Q4F35_06360 [Akkermansia sp.]|nr:hypothetical protein [Akkermansia sp.]
MSEHPSTAPTATEPTPQTVSVSALPQPELEVQGIPPVLVWAVGTMSLLMCLVAIGMGLYCYWEQLHQVVKIVSLLMVPVLLWCGYGVAARYGLVSTEVAATFACLSWLVLLIMVQSCLYALPLWQMGLIFMGGLLLLPLLHPWRTAMLALAIGTAVEISLIWWGAVNHHGGAGFELLWVAVLTSLMFWAVGGAWCRITRRKGYAVFGRVAPLSYGLFLCCFYAQIIAPGLFESEGAEMSLALWAALSALWFLSVAIALPLHIRFALQRHCPLFRYSVLAFGGLSFMAVPLLLSLRMPFLTAPLAFAYAMSIIWYGADYKSPWLVMAGCVAFFLSSLTIPLLLGINPLGSAVILLILGAVGLFIALSLSARRHRLLAAMQIARSRQCDNMKPVPLALIPSSAVPEKSEAPQPQQPAEQGNTPQQAKTPQENEVSSSLSTEEQSVTDHLATSPELRN